MKPLITLLVLTVFAFITSGCSVTAGIPAMRMDSPEAVGRGRISKDETESKQDDRGIRLALGFQGSSELTLVKDYTAKPPQVNQPVSSKDPILGTTSEGRISLFGMDNLKPTADFSLIERLDISFRPHWDHPWMFGGKFQILGDSEKRAKKGNFSLAVTGSVGYASDNYEYKGEDPLQPLTNRTTAKADFYYYAYDAALILGYRPIRDLLIYGGPYFQNLNITGEITQPWNGSEKYNVKGNATTTGGNFGLQCSIPQDTYILFIKFEGSYSKLKYKTEALEPVYAGFQFGSTF